MRQIATYQTLREAIVKKKHVRCRYHGFSREICPHVIGLGKGGEEKVLTFQYGGGSSRGALPPGGQWRCMEVAEISNVEVFDGDGWRTGRSHLRPQTCVKDIDVEVTR